MNETIFFNAHHAPIGAFSSFTLGCKGPLGGPGRGLGAPASVNVYMGLEAREGNMMELLPFYEGGGDDSKRYDPDGDKEKEGAGDGARFIRPFQDSSIKRGFHAAADTWEAGDLKVNLYSQVRPIPDPEKTGSEGPEPEALLKEVLLPAVLVEFIVDNTSCSRTRTAVFGYDGPDPYDNMYKIEDEALKLSGIGQGGRTALYCQSGTATPAVSFNLSWILDTVSKDNWQFGLGNTGALVMEAPAGEKTVFRFALCFFHEGRATFGMDTVYYYTKWFGSISQAGAYALSRFDAIRGACEEADRRLLPVGLSEEQRFMLAQAIRSYYGSTQLLLHEGKPLYIVNEGEYRMMNTLDLTADQVFFELHMNPWAVKNVLDLYLERYSYEDRVRFPGGTEDYPGGLSFTHDMGVANVFSPPGQSAYEMGGLDGCFSYMSHEQLVNWLLCALSYIEVSGDGAWLHKRLTALEACLASMENRDHPKKEERNGIMGLDGVKTRYGAEITTYDSLDASLGQARGNLYLAVKSWSAYVGLEGLFGRLGLAPLAARAGEQARKCAKTLTAHVNEEGYIPAILEGESRSAILSAVEGLVFPLFTGCGEVLDRDGPYRDLLNTLEAHFTTVLKKGICLFEDGGWRLSSTSTNSWLSKIYICQFVVRKVLGIKTPAVSEEADRAHAAWLLERENSFWCWSDQIHEGVVKGSRYYPRGVTAVLWLYELEDGSPNVKSGFCSQRRLP